MNKMTFGHFERSLPLLRRTELYGLLDAFVRSIELTPTQFDAAKANYEAVGDWLADSEHEALRNLKIYVHGSTALGTTVKPLGRDEHDVDLICYVPGFSPLRAPLELKALVGERLRENAKYAAILEEKMRCWRLNYARQFHLDISPTIQNPACMQGGELVPDKKLRVWKPTNPKGYRAQFERRASLAPRLGVQKAMAADSATVELFPNNSGPKGILRRIVQLLKRHRDIVFMDVKEDIAPISIIITTLASQAYEYCIGAFEFDTELDIVIATIRLMPHFIERSVVSGKRLWIVANETTKGENFAERWNSEPERAEAFFKWHEHALEDFEGFASLEGIDRMKTELGKALGSRDINAVIDNRTREISEARSAKTLYVAPAVGLSLSPRANATPMPRNTHFGDR